MWIVFFSRPSRASCVAQCTYLLELALPVLAVVFLFVRGDSKGVLYAWFDCALSR